MKYRTQKAKELNEKIKNLRQAQRKEEERCRSLYINYCCMEGKYGEKVYDDYVLQGQRGYHYAYGSHEIARKEEEERKQYLKDNNYKTEDEIYAEYGEKIKPLLDAFNLEQYGMTTEQKRKADYIAKREREIRETMIDWEEELKKFREENGL